LEAGAIVCKLTDAVKDQVNDLFADCVVSARKVVCSVLFSTYELLRVEQLAVRACANFIDDGGLEVNHHASGNVLASTSLAEEGVERVIAAADCLVAWHLAVGLDAMLEAEKLPAGIPDLNTGLSDVDAKCLTHGCCCED